MSTRAIRKQLDKLRGELHATVKPISQWRPEWDGEYLGVGLDTKVDIHTLLAIVHNAYVYQYAKMKGILINDVAHEFESVPVKQQWKDAEVSQ